MKKLEFSDLKKGMKIKDMHGNISTIIHCKDIHFITVKFKTGTEGYGFYSLDPSDKNYNILYEC